MARSDDVLSTYERIAELWASERSQDMFEAPWLARMLSLAPGPRVLDLGCGSGRPISVWLTGRSAQVTGVDGAAGMCAMFRRALPSAKCHTADMRGLSLGETFDAILAWNSFFHLAPADQRAMFGTFARHAAPGAALMFTAGPRAGEPIGEVGGQPIYHASLEPEEYRALLQKHGFDVVDYGPEDPHCRDHTIWLARYTAATAA